MEERRQYVRLAARLPVRCAVLPSGLMQDINLKDLSGGGLRMVTDAPVASGEQLQVAIQLPGQEQPVNAIAEMVWSRTAQMSGRIEQARTVETGVRFTEIAPQDRDAILAAIAKSLRILQI